MYPSATLVPWLAKKINVVDEGSVCVEKKAELWIHNENSPPPATMHGAGGSRSSSPSSGSPSAAKPDTGPELKDKSGGYGVKRETENVIRL